ncbi:MAG: 2-hydroxyacid dehydrogenase [Dehalococcoidia bacterium]|nr:2-hydroxyacid dehydrogenase [Dehalococcoidia bacterium]
MLVKKVLILSPLPEDAARMLIGSKVTAAELEGVVIATYKGSSQADLVQAVADADVIIGDYTNNVAMDADVMRAAKQCVLIQQPSTGYQHIDVNAAAREGIPVANTAGTNTFAVAEHTIMLILACLRKLLLAHEKTRRAEWAQDEMPLYGVFELWGKTLGIIGMGRIGKEVARRAKPFGPRLIYYDVDRLSPELERSLDLTYHALDEVMAQSDVITLHTPLTPQTTNLINAERIAKMKPNVVIVNVSRGAIVDEAALAVALKEKRIQGAGLDVFADEPIMPKNPLLDAPNIILTPHIAGATNESRSRIIEMTIDNVVSMLRGQEPVNIVNGVKPRFSR